MIGATEPKHQLPSVVDRPPSAPPIPHRARLIQPVQGVNHDDVHAQHPRCQDILADFEL